MAALEPRQVISRAFTQADTGATTVALDVPAKTFVPAYGVSLIVTEALDGGTPSATVGDAADPNGWVDTVDVTETTTGAYTGTEYYAITGKYYPDGGQITITLAADLTDGTAYVVAKFVELGDRV